MGPIRPIGLMGRRSHRPSPSSWILAPDSWRSIRRRLSHLFLEVQVGVAAEAALVVV
jgi:hypothetical protein